MAKGGKKRSRSSLEKLGKEATESTGEVCRDQEGLDLLSPKRPWKECVAEPPNLMPHRNARLPLDTKHSRENTKLLGFVGHTTRENPKIHIFAIRITNERINVTSFLTISYITLIQHQSIIIIIITAE